MGLQTLATRDPIFSDLGCSFGHVLSKTKSVTPHSFYISDISKSSSSGKRFRKKNNVGKFRANFPEGHVTRSNFSCNLQPNKRCVASCKKKFTCNTPFCNCNCCVASCQKSRTTLYFSQRCETSCLRVTSPQLATQFCQNGPIRAHLS